MLGRARFASIRRPCVPDVQTMVTIINARAAEGLILPRSQNYVYQNLRDFCVAEENGKLVGCGSLHVLWGDLGEIRGLATTEEAPVGLEGQLVQALLAEGRRLGLPHVFAFMSRPQVLLEQGFVLADRDSLPRIAWRECIDCVKFPNCDEVPVWIDL